MLVLGIDTSTKIGAIALYDTERGIISEFSLYVKINHSDTLMEVIDNVIKSSGFSKKDIDRIAVGIGPGSFTGIRVGLGTAKGLAHALDCEIKGVNVLDALAYAVPETDKTIISIVDARKGRVYYSKYYYENGNLRRNCDYYDGELTEILDAITCNEVIFTGDGAVAYEEIIVGKKNKNIFLNNKHSRLMRGGLIAELGSKGEGDNIFDLDAFYLSKSQAERMKNK